jgi:hypothetical protein
VKARFTLSNYLYHSIGCIKSFDQDGIAGEIRRLLEHTVVPENKGAAMIYISNQFFIK